MSTKRKTNWCEGEIAVLTAGVSELQDVVEGKFSMNLSFSKKVEAWLELTNRTNSVGHALRTVEEVKKKWADMKSLTKRKERQRRKALKETGGGPPPEALKQWEETVVSCLSTSVIEGFTNGVDTFDKPAVIESTSTIACADPCTSPEPSTSGTYQAVGDTYHSEGLITDCQLSSSNSMTEGSCECSSLLIQIEKERLMVEKEALAVKKAKFYFLKESSAKRETQTQQLIDMMKVHQCLSDPWVTQVLHATEENN